MLKKLKQMLGLLKEDESMDDKLSWILDSTQARLKVLLGGMEPGDDLEYIIIEVSIARYNRIGSEGLSTHTVEGESQNFQESDSAPTWMTYGHTKKHRIRMRQKEGFSGYEIRYTSLFPENYSRGV